MKSAILVWLAFGIAGIAFAVGVGFAAAKISSEQIGLTSEPLSAGEDLAPDMGPAAEQRKKKPKPAPKPRPAPTTPIPTPTPAPPVSESDQAAAEEAAEEAREEAEDVAEEHEEPDDDD